MMPKQAILVITNKAGYHNSKEVQNFIKKMNEIILEFISPYSPEMNPDEQVWDKLK